MTQSTLSGLLWANSTDFRVMYKLKTHPGNTFENVLNFNILNPQVQMFHIKYSRIGD